MISFESEAARIIDKLNEGNFNLWKFEMKMLLTSMDLWDIVDGCEGTPPSNAEPKVLKEYKRHIKKAMPIISLNLANNQFVHIKNCEEPAKVWTILCNIHETNNLSNILFISHNKNYVQDARRQ